MKRSFTWRKKKKRSVEEERDRRRQSKANANRSVESLRLRATDAKLIKNRRTSVSRGTEWSGRKPLAPVFSVRQRGSKTKRTKQQQQERRGDKEKRRRSQDMKAKGNSRIDVIPLLSKRRKTKEKEKEGKKILYRNSDACPLKIWIKAIYIALFLATATELSTALENYATMQILVLLLLSSFISKTDHTIPSHLAAN